MKDKDELETGIESAEQGIEINGDLDGNSQGLMTGAEVAEKYWGYIQDSSLRVCYGDINTASEVASRVAYYFLKDRGRRFTDAGVKSYISETAKSKFANFHRGERRRLRFSLQLGSIDEETSRSLENMQDTKLKSPLEVSCLNEMRDRVRTTVNSLQEKDRIFLDLKYSYGLTYLEIAELTGEKIGTIKSRIFRALDSLRPLLQEYSPLAKMGYSFGD